MNPKVRSAISIVLVIASVFGLMNVYGDNADVVALGKKVACDECEARLVQQSRSPLAQTFGFQLTPSTQVVIVECSRTMLLVGEYQCRKEEPNPR